jgi:predicted acylesterase/phospholipase RssA
MEPGVHRIRDSVVVLDGGGLWGVAWITGIIMGLAEQGIDLAQARAFIGTSAGSIVGTQVADGYAGLTVETPDRPRQAAARMSAANQ